MQKEADTVPDPDLEIKGGPGPTDLGTSVAFKCECHIIM